MVSRFYIQLPSIPADSRSCTQSILPVGRNQKRRCRLWSKPTETKHSIAEFLGCSLTLASATGRQHIWEYRSRAKSSLCGKLQIILSLSYNNLRIKWLMDAQDEPRRDRDVFSRIDWSQEKHDWGEDESVYVYPCWTLAYRRSGKKPKTTPTRMNNGNDTAFSQRQPQQSREWLFRRRLTGFGVDDRDYVQKLDCICMALVLE